MNCYMAQGRSQFWFSYVMYRQGSVGSSRVVGYSPENKRVSRLFPSITDGIKRRHLLGSYPRTQLPGGHMDVWLC